MRDCLISFLADDTQCLVHVKALGNGSKLVEWFGEIQTHSKRNVFIFSTLVIKFYGTITVGLFL